MKLPGTDVDLDDRLEPLLVPIEDLHPDAMNPRRAKDIEGLARRFARYGYTDPVVVNRETKVIEAGHMRIAACRSLGATHVPAVFVDHDVVQGRAFNIAHNRSSEDVAEWDRDALAELLVALQDEDDQFDVIGFTDDDMAMLGMNVPDFDPSSTDQPRLDETTGQPMRETMKCPRCGHEFKSRI